MFPVFLDVGDGVPCGVEMEAVPAKVSAVGQLVAKFLATKKGSAQFKKDRARCSLCSGSHPLLVRARERLAALPGSMELILSLLQYDPARRPSMSFLLTHSVFRCFAVDSSTD